VVVVVVGAVALQAVRASTAAKAINEIIFNGNPPHLFSVCHKPGMNAIFMP
jgi:hypothetical protein